MKLSIIYITSRFEPRLEWFFESLWLQDVLGAEVIVVCPKHSTKVVHPIKPIYVEPKPTIWSGPHRITKADWFSASNARNTGLCLAKGEWVAFLDDRSVLLPGWIDRIRDAMEGEYVVCGTYQKVHDLVVENGAVKSFTTIPGRDSRLEYTEKFWIPHFKKDGPFKAPGEWTYGCSLALPLEWALQVGGMDELCDGISGEDYVFGLMLQNNGYPIYFDPRMKMIEDRTPGQCDPVAIRKDKGDSPNDKSHGLLAKLRVLKHATLPPDLRSIRAMVQSGKPFPAPTSPTLDWYDNEPISQMT